MKKFIAVIFALIFVFSFAACNKYGTTADTSTKDEVASTEAATQPTTENKSEGITEVATDHITELPIEGTVAAWYYENKDEVDKYCAENSVTGDGYALKLVITAEANTLVTTVYMSGMAESDKEESVLGAADDQANWNKKTAAEKAEILESYPEIFEKQGIPGMPVPEAVKTVLCDEKGEIVASTLYTK